jgi:hypothetical protein
MIDTVATAEARKVDLRISTRLEWFDRRRLLLIVMVVAGVVYLQFGFWKIPARGDRANWDYFAQVVSRGGVAYRDVHNIKAPLSAYIGAAAIAVTRPFGLRDMLAIRLMYIFLAVLTVGFTFLVTLDYFGSRRMALLAAMIMLSINSFGVLNSGGVQPKTPMVLFGLMTLWAIKRDWPLWAGIFGTLSALSWQPGLLFVGAAGLAFSRYLTSWRDMRVARLLAGAALPVVITVLYFLMTGALEDFYRWTIHYNYTVYGPREMKPFLSSFNRVGGIIRRAYRGEGIYFYLAAVGIIVVVAREAWLAIKGGARYLVSAAPGHAIVIAPLVYFVFCMINLQGGADLIPFLPFVGMFAAVAIIYALDQVTGLLSRYLPGIAARPGVAAIRGAAFATAFACVFAFSVADAFSYKRSPTLQDQDVEIAEIKSHLGPGDKIYVHGKTEILVLSGLTNASKYFFLDRGKDLYLSEVEPGGFAGWFERLKAERPKVVALSRIRPVEHGKDFLEWVKQDYVKHEGKIFSYYVRKDAEPAQ